MVATAQRSLGGRTEQIYKLTISIGFSELIPQLGWGLWNEKNLVLLGQSLTSTRMSINVNKPS
jgi:hypothetical protein